MERIITQGMVEKYSRYLREGEKAKGTIQKYMTDIKKLVSFADGREITMELMIEYKEYLREQGYKAGSINSFLVAVNGFFEYMKWYGLRVKSLKVQKEAFLAEEKELTKEEYKKLVRTAKKQGKYRLSMIIMTICVTGIRVSELRFLTVSAARKGMMDVDNKGKIRKVILPDELKKALLQYITIQKIKSGIVFCTKSRKAVHRSNIWREMKELCEETEINPDKVFPHNLRHLFARIHYKLHKDIVKLADILGHSSVETTRIYTKTSSTEYKRQLSQMRLMVRC